MTTKSPTSRSVCRLVSELVLIHSISSWLLAVESKILNVSVPLSPPTPFNAAVRRELMVSGWVMSRSFSL